MDLREVAQLAPPETAGGAILAPWPEDDALHAETERRRAQGIPTILVTTDRLADVPRLARLLGLLGGRMGAGDSLARQFASALDSAPATDRARPDEVLILAWDQPPIVIGAGSFLRELVERAGGRNVFGDLAAASAPVSLEAIASRDIDVVLVLGDSVPAFARRAEWMSVRAVREQRFIYVPSALFSRPGSRSPARDARPAPAPDTSRPASRTHSASR